MVVKAIAVFHGDSCRATHTNMIIAQPTFLKNPIRMLRTVLGFAGLPGGYPDYEIKDLKEMTDLLDERTGYQKIQSTKPQASM